MKVNFILCTYITILTVNMMHLDYCPQEMVVVVD